MSGAASETARGPVSEAAGAAPAPAAPVLDVRGVTKVYGRGETEVRALRGVSLTVEKGDYVAIMGASGSGKSTLMNILGCLDVPSGGRYLIDGTDIGLLDDRRLALLRNRKIGFVFQSFNLIPRMSALANVELPLAYGGVRQAERRARALAALEQVGLADRVRHEPNELSGGQQQRVAVARALVTAPALLLADEPTGNLDTRATADVLDVLDRLNDAGRTIVLITHEDDVARHAKRVVRLVDGEITEDHRRAGVADPPPARRAAALGRPGAGGPPGDVNAAGPATSPGVTLSDRVEPAARERRPGDAASATRGRPPGETPSGRGAGREVPGAR